MAREQTHAEIRRARLQEIETLTGKLRKLEEAQQTEKKSGASLESEIGTLAEKAAAGDRDALKRQRGLLDKQSEHSLQAANLARLAAPIRSRLSQLQASLPGLELAEQIAKIIEQDAVLRSLSRQLSGVVEPVATAFGAFKARLDAVVATALPLLGDADHTRRLEKSLREGVVYALRAQLNVDFYSHGISLFEQDRFAGQTFEGVMAPRLANLRGALEAKLHSGGASEGRAVFRATRNVSGLLGLEIKPGEELSLPIADPKVIDLVKHGALEEVGEKGASA